MTAAGLLPLAQLSLRNPRAAAHLIVEMQLGREVLWTALALVAAVYTLAVQLRLTLAPPNLELPGYFDSPLALFMLSAGTLVLLVHAMYWAGLSFAGKGGLMDMLAVLVWLQALQVAALVSVLAILLLLPPLAMALSMLFSVWSFWILLNFIAVALQLPSLGHAFMVLIVSAVGLILGAGIFVALIGLIAQGVLGNV